MLVKSRPSAVCKHMNWMLYGITLFGVFSIVSGGKVLQYFCSSLPLTWLMDERRLVFYRKAMVHSNIVIRTLMSVSGVYVDYIGLCHKYQIPNPYCSVSYIKHAIWRDFVKCVDCKPSYSQLI